MSEEINGEPILWMHDTGDTIRHEEWLNGDSHKREWYHTALYPSVPAGWQPIETAPNDGREILVFNSGLIRIGFFDVARNGVWSTWPGRAHVSPTHWMPLPAAPKGETA